ncbi:hypothetical protein [Bacillus sp. JJ1562]|uniref:hypothetical protein n=1 Tax=Bacillus sp. JJ1562 TaxID=3122960 RepID=UPI003003057C
MRKYLGIVSILILIVTYLILQTIVGKDIGQLWILIIAIGYLASAFASWYSTSGFWRKASATILIILPVAFLIFIIGMIGNGF